MEGTSSSHGASSRHLSQVGPVYADVPDDLQDLSSLLAVAREAFPFFGQGMYPTPDRQRYTPRSRALGGISNRSPGSVSMTVTFTSSHADMPVRLPGTQRSYNMTVRSLADESQQACAFQRLPYLSQTVGQCNGMNPGSKWIAELVDAGASGMLHPGLHDLHHA